MSQNPIVRRLEGRIGASRWEAAMRAPTARLRPWIVGDYTGYSERAPYRVRRREFPVPFAVMAIEFGPPLRLLERGAARRVASHRGGFVGGVCDDFVDCEHDGFQAGIQVNLTPIGARLLFGMPMSELSAGVAPVADLLPARHHALPQRLGEAVSWEARFDLLDAALADSLREADDRTRLVSWAVRRIEESGGVLSMRRLARELGYSGRHTIALFRDQVGIPPKALARIVRFHRLMGRVRAGGGDWSDLAVDLGFFDQSHLVREVRLFTGVTPTQVRGMVTDLSGLLDQVTFFQDAPAAS